MFNNSLDKKPFFKKKDGQTVRDITQSMFDFKTNDYSKLLPYKIPKEYVMRPDLISQAVFNTTLHTEIVLKYNGISNPFTIEEGDIIVIPDINSAKQNIKRVTTEAESKGIDNIRKSYKYVDPAKFPKKDETIDEFRERNLDKKVTVGDKLRDVPFLPDSIGVPLISRDISGEPGVRDGALPPNIAEEGVTQITQRNGRIYFGEGISESACLKNGMSTSEFLTGVIKSRKV